MHPASAIMRARVLLALDTSSLVGTRPVLTGPESSTLAEQVRVVGEVLGAPVRFEEIPTPVAQAEMIEAGWPPDAVDGLLAAYAEMAAGPAPVTDEVERIAGRPARTFREWVADHRADFSVVRAR